ncbi:MAG: ERCC4 domain-containing protein, partial [Candidatus Thorarchaeota archaeon]
MIIIVDSNEASKAPKIAKALMKDFEVVIEPLTCGDYLFIGSEEHRPLLVERKTVTDFMGSVRDRLIPQLKCLKEFEEKGDICLLFEGWMGLIRKRTKWK